VLRRAVLILARIGAAYAWCVAVLLAIGIISGIENGPLAVAQILAPHLALACLALMVVAVVARSRALVIALAAVFVLFTGRFGGEWWSPSQGTTADDLRVATWNLEAGERAGADAVRLLGDHPADIVALQELTPEVAAAIESDPVLVARFPHRALEPRPGVAGIGLLSRFPIATVGDAIEPVRLEARIRLPDRTLVVLNAHPFPARIGTLAGIPVGLDPTVRNGDLERLRSRVAELEAAGDDVLFIGDFNTAPTEPAFRRLTGALHDAHAEVGLGPGWTWRPARFAFLGIGLLRIDLVLSTPALRPLAISTACPSRGDHCLVEATLAFTR
jgi:endonuclease/exonuclease/phosphatase (EEP) superfamily protein YafD